MSEVFLSHSSAQKQWVETLGRNLESINLKVFIDRWHIVAGKSWVTQLDDALERCDAALLVVTKAAVESGWVREEYEKLLRRKKQEEHFPLIPIILDGVSADLPFIGSIHFVDFRQPIEYREAFARLIAGLQGQPPGPRPYYDGQLEIPAGADLALVGDKLSSSDEDHQASRSASSFLVGNSFVMVLSARRSGVGDLVRHLSDVMSNEIGIGNVHRVHLPFAAGSESHEQFDSELCRQFCGDIDTAVTFEQALRKRLTEMDKVWLIVDGVEHAHAEHRSTICKQLRAIADETDALRALFVGGQRLHELKFSEGNLSVLAGAETVHWPVANVGELLSTDPFWEQTKAEVQSSILDAAGGDIDLARELLRSEPVIEDTKEIAKLVASSEWLYGALVSLMRDEKTRAEVKLCAEKMDLGPWRPYFAQETLRRLYWTGLAVRDKRRLRWRSEQVRQGAISCVQEFS